MRIKFILTANLYSNPNCVLQDWIGKTIPKIARIYLAFLLAMFLLPTLKNCFSGKYYS